MEGKVIRKIEEGMEDNELYRTEKKEEYRKWQRTDNKRRNNEDEKDTRKKKKTKKCIENYLAEYEKKKFEDN